MIFGRLLAGSGNPNTMKRWWRFQQAITKKRWWELDRERNGPISLWDFRYPEDALDAAWVDEKATKGGWRISDDSVIGGYSKATFELVRSTEDYQRVLRGDSSISMTDPSIITDTINSTDMEAKDDDGDDDEEAIAFTPFVRWKGTIDTSVNNEANTEKTVLRSGFCAIRSPSFPFTGADLGGRYNALEITCRSDGRPYSVNLKCESFIEDDLFQCFINVPPTISSEDALDQTTGGKFDQVVLLFQHFIVTSGGRMRANQRVLDNSIKIQSIGFTLMDGVDGDFQFDLARIRAVNYDETGVIGEEN